MLNQIATKLSQRLLLKQVITADYFDIYVYGFELLISSLLSTSLILIFGILMGQLLQTITFLIVFILLRSFSGGYHANTYIFCSIVTFSCFGIVLLLSHFVTIHWGLYFLLAVVGILLLLTFAPIENPNKKITPAQRKKHKKTSVILFSVMVLLGLLLTIFFPSIGSTIFFTLIADLILLFIKTKRKEKSNESF